MTQIVDPPFVDPEELRASIRAEYAAVAAEPDRGFHFHTGYRLAAILGYRQEWIETLPPGAVASLAGTGNPFALGEIHPGERLVDCGSGAGADALIAAGMVGPSGRVIGIDMTPEMVAKARANAAEAGLANVEFREGIIEALPVENGWADVVISNGVLNLIADKAAALAEIYRVLRPGGRLQAADIVIERPVSASSKQDVSLWTGCIAGGLLADELRELIATAGFTSVEVVPGDDVFAGAPQASNAAAFGTRGAGIRASRSWRRHGGGSSTQALDRRWRRADTGHPSGLIRLSTARSFGTAETTE
jgi:arsenite methyltransferase